MLTIPSHFDPSASLSDLDRDDLINYEYQMFEKGIPQVQPTLGHIDKYAEWHLEAKVSQLVGSTRCRVRWIGNAVTSHLSAYVYLLLVTTEHTPQSFLQFKHAIYRLAKKCLNVSQQKTIVEFFYLIEYARDRHSFLNKYPQIEGIMIKLLEFVEEENLKEASQRRPDPASLMSPVDTDTKSTLKPDKPPLNLNYQQSNLFNNMGSLRLDSAPPEAETARQVSSSIGMSFSSRLAQMGQEIQSFKQLQQLYSLFNSIFPFVSLLHCNQHSYTFQLFRKSLVYVVVEKRCFFLLEPLNKPDSNGINFTLGGKQRREDFVRKSQTDSRAESRVVGESQHIEPGDQSVMQHLLGDQENSVLSPPANLAEIEESKVIRIDRGSQIRSNKKARKYTMNTFSPTTPSQQFEKRASSIIMKNESKMTFIDELLNQVSLNDVESLKHVQKSQLFEQTLSQIVQEQPQHPKIESIKQIKGELEKLRQKLEDKLTAKFPNSPNPNPNPLAQEQVEGKIISCGSADKLDIFRKKDQVVENSKKDRKFSYNSQLSFVVRPTSPFPKPGSSFKRKTSFNKIPQTASAKTLPQKPAQPQKQDKVMQKSMMVKKQRAALWEKRSRDKARLSRTPEPMESKPKERPLERSFHAFEMRSPSRFPQTPPPAPANNVNVNVNVSLSSSTNIPLLPGRTQMAPSPLPPQPVPAAAVQPKRPSYYPVYISPTMMQQRHNPPQARPVAQRVTSHDTYQF